MDNFLGCDRCGCGWNGCGGCSGCHGCNHWHMGCRGILHIVKKGDTLYKISRRYGVPLKRVMYANPYVDVYNLQIGDEICVPIMGLRPLAEAELYRGDPMDEARPETVQMPVPEDQTQPENMQQPVYGGGSGLSWCVSRTEENSGPGYMEADPAQGVFGSEKEIQANDDMEQMGLMPRESDAQQAHSEYADSKMEDMPRNGTSAGMDGIRQDNMPDQMGSMPQNDPSGQMGSMPQNDPSGQMGSMPQNDPSGQMDGLLMDGKMGILDPKQQDEQNPMPRDGMSGAAGQMAQTCQKQCTQMALGQQPDGGYRGWETQQERTRRTVGEQMGMSGYRAPYGQL